MSGRTNIGDHVEPEDLADVLRAPESDARRRHLSGCTRCQMLVEAYQGFLEEPKELDPAADALKQSLVAAIAVRFGRLVQGRADDPVPLGRPAAGTPGFLAAVRSRLARLLSQPIPAIAMLALIGGAVIIFRQVMPESRDVRLRQRPPSHVGGTAGNVELAAVDQPDGSIELSWSPVAGADSYEIRIYSGSLDEVARMGPQLATRLRLSRADPAMANVHGTFLIKVIALDESDLIGESRPIATSWP